MQIYSSFLVMKPLLLICEVLIPIIFEIVTVCTAQQLEIRNNGPVVLDDNITFSTFLRNYEAKHDLHYILNDGVQQTEYHNRDVNVTISRTFPSNLYLEGSYFMNVTVKEKTFFTEKVVVDGFSKFELKRSLIGQIYVYRDMETHKDVDEVAVGENVSIVMNLIDHRSYLEKATIDYVWSIDYEKYVTLGDTLIYNFTDAGTKIIKAIVTATFPNNEFKYGFFERTIQAKVPVKDLSVSGDPFIYHGDTLDLVITCNGTPPFKYCYKIYRANISVANFSCTPESAFSACHMEIQKYFQNDGKYNIGIYVTNDVEEVKRVIEVMIYSVKVDPTLSLIIIPIVCSLLTLIIIAVGISYCIQQRNQLAVEVANFDFQEESDSYTEKTFFENIFDSLRCNNCNSRLNCRNPSPSEVEPLV